MESIVISLNAVLPLFIMTLLGFVLKKTGIVSSRAMKQMNRICYLIFIPLLLFNNIYKTELEDIVHPGLIIFAVISVLAIWVISIIISLLTEKTPQTRGAMIQGMYRSNFTLYGLPIVTFLFGSENVGITSFLIAIVVPMFNVMAIITLETFRGGKSSIGKIAAGVVKNPLMIGSVLGILALAVDLHLPAFIETSINSLSSLAVPLSLIIMGASFSFTKIRHKKWQLALTVAMRMLIFPAVFLSISILLGFRDIQLASLMALFASPTAIVSYPMAVQMESDGEFACGVLMFTTIISIATVFLFVFLLQYFGYILL